MAAGSNQLPLCASFEFVEIGQGEEGVGGGGGRWHLSSQCPSCGAKCAAIKAIFAPANAKRSSMAALLRTLATSRSTPIEQERTEGDVTRGTQALRTNAKAATVHSCALAMRV
jgi:hypothetical protein